MLDDPTDSRGAKAALARTYNHPSYPDPWEAVRDYERVQRAAGEHPEKGSSALSRVVELPRGRIRGWIESDAMPDAYRGLQTAQENNWILDAWTDPPAKALVVLSAWILASGSINKQWTPRFVADTPDEIDTLRSAAQQAELSVQSVRGESEDRPLEWEPRRDARVLGRVLYTWTGARGYKAEDETRFPVFPGYAPPWVARVFAQTYLALRATPRPETPEPRIQIAVYRNDGFYRDLAALLERVVDDASMIRGDSLPLSLTGRAAEDLHTLPRLDE